jgi:hemerythrin-like domain-containing protein
MIRVIVATGAAAVHGAIARLAEVDMHAAVAVITQEHRSITAVISALEYLAREVAGGGEPDYEVLTVILDYIETFPNRLHHPKEDRYLFSALRRPSASAAQILDDLEAEHRRGDELTRELRYLLARCRVGGAGAKQAFAAAVERYATFHWAHMRKEEDLVLPLAHEALTPGDWEAIDAAFGANDDPVPGLAPRQELDALFRLIVAMAPPPVGVGRSAAERQRG